MAQSFTLNYVCSSVLRLVKQNALLLLVLGNTLFVTEICAEDNPIALTSSDNKKLNKAAKEAAKGDDKTKEADKVFADVAARQSELTSEETDKLNNKAIGYQVEALQFKYNSDKMKYDVYSAKAPIFWDKYKGTPESAAYAKSLETDAKDNFSQSETPFSEAKSEKDNLLKYSKLSTATDYSTKAYDKIKQAYEMYSNLIQNPVTTNPVQEPVVNTEVTPVQEQPVQEVVKEETPHVVEETPKAEEVKVEEQPVVPVVEEKPVPVVKPVVSKPRPVANIASEGSIRVQIAASRVPLTAGQLQQIYNGTEQPREDLINDWYKYSIGPFGDLSAAIDFKDKCGVKGAFIVHR